MSLPKNQVIQNDALEKVILVDHNNNPLGTMDKLLAHKDGALHRAFSVFIFSSKHKLLIQKRANTKYHSPNQWANTCCGHPRENESTIAAATRRLEEEMGFSVLLYPVTEFVYKADLNNNLREYEYVHFFIGFTDQHPNANLFEVSDYLWISQERLMNTGLNLAPWFKLYLKDYKSVIDRMFSKAIEINNRKQI